MTRLTDENNDAETTGELQEHVHDLLGDHRALLERVARLDTDLSDDAYRALQILDATDQNQEADQE